MTARYSSLKLDAAIKLAQEFGASNFPHKDSSYVVAEILYRLRLMKARVDNADRPPFAEGSQRLAAVLISDALETMGIVANSTNVRNAFEVHGPVLTLARSLLKKDKRLILTFEWNYIPYTLPVVPLDLENVVVIGLPASEASNAFVLPAVGHELGHLLWSDNNVTQEISKLASEKANELRNTTFADRANALIGSAQGQGELDTLTSLSLSVDWSIRQLEEVFCDLTGLYLFGPSFLDCFEYMLEPPPMRHRDPLYPSVKQRASFLQDSSARFRAEATSFADKFEEQQNPFEKQAEADRFALDLADAVTRELAPAMADRVHSLCSSVIAYAPQEMVEQVSASFMLGIPAERADGLDSILNAGWITFKNPDFMTGEADETRMAALNELIFKSIEILEIEKIMGHATQA